MVKYYETSNEPSSSSQVHQMKQKKAHNGVHQGARQPLARLTSEKHKEKEDYTSKKLKIKDKATGRSPKPYDRTSQQKEPAAL